MAEAVGVRFREAGKVYYFDTGGMLLKSNDLVIVKTKHGLELGTVVLAPDQTQAGEKQPAEAVLRKASPEDLDRFRRSRSKERETLERAKEFVRQLELPMKPVAAQSNLEGNFLTVFFTAEARVDFRELVRKLSRAIRARVELKQVGPRDEAKLVGGLGKCGCVLCCKSFLCEFAPVSIKMAKEQESSLSSMKISGLCGRLLCCLGYESDQYRAMKEKMPKAGQTVSTPMGQARVTGINIVKETVTAELENQVTVDFPLAQVTWEGKAEPSERTTTEMGTKAGQEKA